MNNNRNNTAIAGIDFYGLLTVAFVVLKLVGIINWSWLWVLAPIWMPVVIGLALVAIIAVVVSIKTLLEK